MGMRWEEEEGESHHSEGRGHHLRFLRQIQPNLKESESVRRLVIDQRKHLSVNNSLASGHPLEIAMAIPTTVAQ
jgi:hypothetical protein